MPMTPYVNESADIFTPGCTVAHGRVGVQDAARRCVPRTEDSDWGSSAASEDEISALTDVEKEVYAREVGRRGAWLSQSIDRTQKRFALKRDLLNRCTGP